MSAPTRKPSAKKPAVKRSPRAAKPTPEVLDEELTEEELAELAEKPAEDDDGEIRPVVIGKRGRKGDTKGELTTIFELDEVKYQIPKEPSPALALRFLRDLSRHGRLVAVERMAFTLLGENALEALAASPDVEIEDVADVFTIVGRIFFESETYRKLMAATDPS